MAEEGVLDSLLEVLEAGKEILETGKEVLETGKEVLEVGKAGSAMYQDQKEKRQKATGGKKKLNNHNYLHMIIYYSPYSTVNWMIITITIHAPL